MSSGSGDNAILTFIFLQISIFSDFDIKILLLDQNNFD